MTLMGTIQDGKIVLDATPLLPDGTRVIVGFKATDDPDSFTLDDIKDLQEGWVEAYPGEFADLAKMVQDDRDTEVRLSVDRGETELD